ncbi:MAG: hypothetical protein H0T79_03750 [Deltaproteobacteria bacterium]|nr:hypothetical protein [Deltaproteobacteria bacterium]
MALVVAVGPGCGDDGAAVTKPGAARPGAKAAAPKAPVPVKPLAQMRTIEDQVRCVGPKEPDDADRCDPKEAVPCKDAKKKYCLTSEKGGTYCAACTERDSIRHVFRDRDFVTEQNRDPFQSYVLVPAGLGSAAKPAVDMSATPKCNEFNSFAASYSYQDLKVVGIVTQGTQRKALMTGGRASYIIKRSDCVGKEKALVKEVGDGYVTFITQPDPNVPDALPFEFTVQLNLNALALNAPETPNDRPAPTTTVPSPTKTTPVPPPAASTTKIQIPAPTPAPQPAPPVAPTQLTP